ncbi:MAG TPA: DUF5683 domain-containing protein [Gemmatimonadota bacterium]|nr:DUF5683 domain-containing protein [Gemmatimonadota bacterium]
MRSVLLALLPLLAAAALAPGRLAAQETPAEPAAERPEVRPSEPIPTDSLAFGLAPADTVPVLAPRFQEGGGREALARVPSEDLLPRNPRNAAIRSFLLPGWGQLYTGHPWRAAFFAAAEVGFFAAGYSKQREALARKDDLQVAREAFFATLPDSVAADTVAATEAFDSTPEAIAIRSDLEDIEETREDFYAYFALSVIFAAVDAYVAAQLDPLAAGYEPQTGRAWAGVRLRIGGPSGRP